MLTYRVGDDKRTSYARTYNNYNYNNNKKRLQPDNKQKGKSRQQQTIYARKP